MEHTRRDLLAGTAVTLSAGAAGCLDFAAGEGPQGPDGVPTTLTCEDDDFVRLEQPFDEPVEDTAVETDSTDLELSNEGTSESYGQSLRIVLRNTGDAPATTRGELAYSLQRETEDGWLDVRGSTTGEAVELPRDEAELDSGSTYSWTITLTETGIADAVDGVDLDVCPPLGPGPYRFVYWGIVDAPPIAAEFELVG